ncbi:MAG TPA: hypothetical protein VI391_07815 [Thermoanaerobaculia bacterium]
MFLAALILASLPILHDNYALARQEAIRRGVPMFVEVWAPW